MEVWIPGRGGVLGCLSFEGEEEREWREPLGTREKGMNGGRRRRETRDERIVKNGNAEMIDLQNKDDSIVVFFVLF